MTRPRGRRSAARRVLDILIVGLFGCAVAGVLLGHRWSARPPAAAVTAVAPSTAKPTSVPIRQPNHPTSRPTPSRAPNSLPRSVPVYLRIPAIGVHTRLVRLGIEPNGALQVPSDFAVAGWYTGGPSPGEIGPAVIAGHIDSYHGPAVFFRLSALRPGDQVRVSEQDGLVALFQVYAVAQYPKSTFPTETVYANTDGPELRLITCGGTFNTHIRSYQDNVVISAKLVATEHG